MSLLIPAYNEGASIASVIEQVQSLPLRGLADVVYGSRLAGGRTYAEGKKITWRDGFKAIWVLVRVRVS